MSPHPLDAPVRAALTSRHAAHARAALGALRYDPAILPFATPDAQAPEALARLCHEGENVVLAESASVPTPPGFAETNRAEAVQMVATTRSFAEGEPRIIALGWDDAADMLALAEATRPGPFTLRALDLGGFWGVRSGGRLIAMAGQRMACPGFTEVSGVCTAPDARGQGLARSLSCHVAARIVARGETPFLHAWSSNAAAISLYGAIGFELRTVIQIAVLTRLAP